jgi:enamine deaminase RidA (YjgF/YER057c/UK114 family)
MLFSQVNVLLKDINAGAETFNALWEQWIDPHHAPVSSPLITLLHATAVLQDFKVVEEGLEAHDDLVRGSTSRWIQIVSQARTTYQAALIRPELLVEIDAVAAVATSD